MTPHRAGGGGKNCVKAAVCEMLDKEERERAAPTRDYTLAVLCVPLVALSLVTKWDFQQFVYSSHYQNTIFPPPPHSHLDEMNKNEESLALSVSNARVMKSCQSFTFLNCDI